MVPPFGRWFLSMVSPSLSMKSRACLQLSVVSSLLLPGDRGDPDSLLPLGVLSVLAGSSW